MNNRLQEESNLPLSERCHSASRELSHQDSPACCYSPHLTLQLSCCLRHVDASANIPECPCKYDMSYFDPPCGVENGKSWRRYIFTYYHDGAWWDMMIPAYSVNDAQARINKISFAQYVGEHHYTIKAGVGGSVLLNLFCFVRNFFRRSTVFRT